MSSQREFIGGQSACHRGPAILWPFLISLLALCLMGGLLSPIDAQADPIPGAGPGGILRDGSSPDRAAPSCWAIKQNDPSSQDDAYWLLTPAMAAPIKLYCDQTYDGGGWVLIGRGREGWLDNYSGQGDPALLQSLDRSPSGFSTVQLDSPTIDGLLNNSRVDSLADGIRVLRAANAQGTEWQNIEMVLAERDRWVWSLHADHPINKYSFDDSWRQGGSTSSFGWDQNRNRMTISFDSSNSWTSGFAYGTAYRHGSTSPSSFLWSSMSNGSSPRPYAEVYLRPMLNENNTSWQALADSGSPAITGRAMPGSYALPNPWGVTGNFNGRPGEGNAPVQDFAQIGSVVYVAGNFARVQAGANGETVQQAALAAFDMTSGDLIRSFAPSFNGQVKAVLALPNGKLLAAGEFTRVNQTPASGTVLLDPTTGEIDPSWNVRIENRISGQPVRVRSLDIQGDYVYLGGAFTHLLGGSQTNRVYARNAARITWTDATPDRSWNPEFNGGVMDIDASADGERLYAAGYFTRSKQIYPALQAAAVQTAAGADPVNPQWAPQWSHHHSYQQTITDAGDRFYVGGSQHSLFGFDATTFERLSGSITKSGGDFQASTYYQGIVIAGCHCNGYTYQDAYSWPSTGDAWTQGDSIRWLGAWDAASGSYLPLFNPTRLRASGGGLWGVFVDSAGTVWAGGDFTGAMTGPTSATWAGGFVRFPAADTGAPAIPQQLQVASSTDTTVTLAWSGVSDSGPVSYEVLRDDRVIASTPATTVQVPRGGQNRYFVRSVDAAGNRSASTAVLGSLETPQSAWIIPQGDNWRYYYETDAPGEAWTAAEFDDSAWAEARAPLGFGAGDVIATDIDKANASDRPIVVYFRKTVTLSQSVVQAGLHLSVVVDDGARVMVNGVEVGRARLSDGAPTHTTWANRTIRTPAAMAQPLEIDVPSDVLVTGTNVIAVSTHMNYRRTRDLSFDLSATSQGSTTPEAQANPEPAPNPDLQGGTPPEQVARQPNNQPSSQDQQTDPFGFDGDLPSWWFDPEFWNGLGHSHGDGSHWDDDDDDDDD